MLARNDECISTSNSNKISFWNCSGKSILKQQIAAHIHKLMESSTLQNGKKRGSSEFSRVARFCLSPVNRNPEYQWNTRRAPR